MNPSVLSGLLLTVFLHGTLAAGLVMFSSWAGADNDRPALEMITIEASLATKSDNPSDQVRRRSKRSRPRPRPKAVKPADSATKPDSEPEEAEPGEEDYTDDVAKYLRYDEEEEVEEEYDPNAEDSAPGGQFDGSEHGFAEVSKGDPYMQKLAADMFASWTVPTLEKGEGVAVGCVRLAEDGSILETELWKPTKNANIDRSVKLALSKLQELRKPDEVPPVPVHLMDATRRWTCFNFPVNANQ